MIFSDNDDESSVEASPIERESNTAGKLTIEDESRLEEDVKAVLEELLCAVQDQIDREKKTGNLDPVYTDIVAVLRMNI